MTIQDIQSLAEAHGLLLTDKMNFKPPAQVVTTPGAGGNHPRRRW